MIRTILVLLFLLCFFIISIPLYLIEAIIGHFDIHKKERSSFVIVTTALKIIIWLSGIHLIVKGQEKVPKDQAVLYVSNHRSYFDIVTLYPLTNNTTGFVAKKELERIPFIKASTVIIEFGDPIDLNAMPKDERRHIGSQVQGIIGGMLKENSLANVES